MTPTAVLPEPKPRYRRVVDRYECPICSQRLGEWSWWPENGRATDTIRLYTDTTHRDITVRVFHPCGCDYLLPFGHGKGA